jgi:hypothetical protein
LLWSPNTQLHYPFQNTALDYSGHARHGTVNGSGVYATKPNGGRCLYFDGVGDYVASPSFGLSGTVVVFAADVRCKFNAANQGIVGNGLYNGNNRIIRMFRMAGTNTLRWRYTDLTNFLAADAPDYFLSPFEDVWLSMVVVCDYAGKTTYFYRDGIPFGSPVAMSSTPAFPSTATHEYLGNCDLVNGIYLIAGYLANVYLGTLATCPPVAVLTANANRLMLGLNPIWPA